MPLPQDLSKEQKSWLARLDIALLLLLMSAMTEFKMVEEV